MSIPEPIGADERHLSGWDFCLLWAGAGIALTEIWAGGLLAPLGFSAGLIAIALGHVIGNTPLALAALPGCRHGVPSMVSTRGAMGVRGSYLPALLNIVQLVGWTAVMLWVGGQAAARLTADILPVGEHFWCIVGGILTTLWALGGHRFWKKLQAVAMVSLLALSVVMTCVLFRQYSWTDLMVKPAAGGMSLMGGIDLVIAMPISWLPLVADYARYARRPVSCLVGTWIGYFLASTWMYAVGLAAAAATGTATPDAMVMDLLASFGLTAAALVIVLVSTFTTTFLDIYSNAVSVLSIAPRLNERLVIALGGLAGTAGACFLNPLQFENFLLFIGATFCPLFGVVFADYFALKRGRYDGAQLFGGALYWYTGGFHLPGLLAWALGFALYLLCMHRWTAWGASLPSMLGAGALYLALAALFRVAARATPEKKP